MIFSYGVLDRGQIGVLAAFILTVSSRDTDYYDITVGVSRACGIECRPIGQPRLRGRDSRFAQELHPLRISERFTDRIFKEAPKILRRERNGLAAR